MTPERSAAVAGRMEGGAAVKECVRALGAAHLLGVGWPKEYGGRGFTAIEQFIFGEEAQRVNAPIPFVTLNTVGPTLIQYGTDGAEAEVPACDPRRHGRVRDRLLRAVRRKRPGVAADRRCPRRRRLHHQRREDVHQRRGRTPITSGLRPAPIRNVKKHKGITIFIVPTSSPGFSWKPLHTMPGVSTFYTFYDDVRVPASSIVAGENEGWKLITTQLNFERAALGNLGCARAAVREDAGVGARPPSSTTDSSSTSRGCSRRSRGSRRRSPPTRS